MAHLLNGATTLVMLTLVKIMKAPGRAWGWVNTGEVKLGSVYDTR